MAPAPQDHAPTVLVVDDVPDVARVVALWLGDRARAVFTATSIKEACVILDREAIDVVVTDILMPEGDGIELISLISRRKSRPRIVAMSGGGSYLDAPSCLDLALAAGAQATLHKPFTAEELFGAVTQIDPPGKN